MNLLELVYPEAGELLEIEKGEMATSVYGLPVYFRVNGSDDADAFHDGAAHAIQISIRYLDVGTDAIQLTYSTDASTETTQTLVTKSDTGKWKWKHKTISSNARFDHSVYANFEYADFALTCDSELILTNVTLRETALNTEAVWKAAEERVTATAGEAAIDTTLFSGWTVNETYLARDTGTNATSAGLAPDDFPFYAGATYANRASAPFRVTPSGALVATSATITGAITATSGAIGGFEIGTDYLRDAANSFGLASTVTGSDDVRFWAGASFASRATAPFRATEAGAVTATNITITGGAIDGAVINNLSITAGKIGNLEITAAQIANSTITGAKIDTGTITATNIANATITGAQIANATITAVQIANATITATQIAAATITGANIASATIAGSNIAAATIAGSNIANATISGANIASGTITSGNIATGTITGGNIASGTITAGNMADLTITAGKIANLTITAAQVNNYTLKLGNLTQEVVNALSQMDARNQLYNGGFEDGSTFWNSGTVQTNSANAHSGNKYLEMTSDGSSSVQVDETGATRYFQVIANQTIRFSTWAYRGSGDRNIWCVVETFDKDYASIAYHISPNVSAATTWTQTSVEFVAESNAKYARVYLEIQNGTTTTTARFDDVTLFILVPGGDIVARTITADRIVAGAITTNEIAAGTITASNIAAGTITASNIASGTITATELAAGAVTASKISVSQLSAIAADLGTITAGTVTSATIRTASSGARTEMNASNLFGLGFGGVGGYDGSAAQWYAKASDGKLYAAGGKLVIDATAMALRDGSSVLTAYFVGANHTLNGESLVAGDVLFGNNDTYDANIKISSGGLATRVGTTEYWSLSGRSLDASNDAGINTRFLTLSVGSGTNKDLDSTGAGSGGSPFYTNCVRITSTGNWTLRSIVTGTDGQWLFLINESANNMTITNGGSAPAGYSAVRTFDGTSPATTNAGCALLVFNATNDTWDLISHRT